MPIFNTGGRIYINPASTVTNSKNFTKSPIGALGHLGASQDAVNNCSSCSGSNTNNNTCNCESDEDCPEGYCCDGECQEEPCGHWCEVRGLDDSERVVCVAERDPDRAAIQRTGELLAIGSPQPCREPGGTCFECLAYATVCTDAGLPEEWEGVQWTCAEARAFAESQITNFLSGTFDCEFEIVEKLREDRTGLEVFDSVLNQYVPLPDAFVKRDWIGCCNQGAAPP